MLELRLAHVHDMKRVFEWRNMPELFAVGTTPRPVTEEEHERWFQEIICSPNHLMWILEPDAGTVRLDRNPDGSAQITIYLLPEFQGKGHGAEIVQSACEWAFRVWKDLTQIRARILPDNIRSIRAFTKAGFSLEGVLWRPST
jgi:RimJ/RimL family protein N-acetyltransferase